MKILKLKYKSKDINILLDDEDFDRVSVYNWSFHGNTFYRYLPSIRNPLYAQGKQKIRRSLSNEVMNTDKILYDHIDRNPFNNQKINLRIVTQKQNARNNSGRMFSDNPYKGVYRDKRLFSNRYKCCIRFERKLIHLGTFIDSVEAARVYDAKAKELFGEFASLNFP